MLLLINNRVVPHRNGTKTWLWYAHEITSKKDIPTCLLTLLNFIYACAAIFYSAKIKLIPFKYWTSFVPFNLREESSLNPEALSAHT